MSKNASLQRNLRRVKIVCRYFILAGVVVLLFFGFNAYAANWWENDEELGLEYSGWYSGGTIFNLDGDSSGSPLDCVDYACKMAIPFNYQGTSTPISVFQYTDYAYTYFPSGSRTFFLKFDFYTNVSSTNPLAGELVASTGQIDLPLPSGVWTQFSASTTSSLNLEFEQDYWLVVDKITVAGGAAELTLGRNYVQSEFPTYLFYKNSIWEEVGGNYHHKYFKLDFDVKNSIQIDFPEDATSTLDFNFWEVSGYALDAGTTIEILSKDSGSTVWTVAGGRYLEEAGGFSDYLLLKYIVLPVDTYQAYALLKYQDILKASSTIITFDIIGINPEIIPYYPTPTSTATSSEWVLTCDPESGLFIKSLCYLGLYLFVPRQQDFNRFNDLKDMLTAKPPVGYFYLIKNSLSGLSSEAEAAFNLPQSAALNDYVFNPVRNGIIFILWLIFARWLFNRSRHFEL